MPMNKLLDTELMPPSFLAVLFSMRLSPCWSISMPAMGHGQTEVRYFGRDHSDNSAACLASSNFYNDFQPNEETGRTRLKALGRWHACRANAAMLWAKPDLLSRGLSLAPTGRRRRGGGQGEELCQIWAALHDFRNDMLFRMIAFG